KIYTEDNRWFVRDFGLNGTRICGTKISGSAELIDGTTIQIGDTRLRFTILPQGTPLPSMSNADVTMTNNIRGIGSSSRIAMATIEKRGTVAVPSSNTTRTAETYHPIKAHSTSNSPPLPGTNSERALTESSNAPPDVASRLKVDELTALTRYMSTAMDTADPQELIRLTLRAILHQTSAKVAGYLSLDPTEPVPKLILPESASVDTQLSRRLTERVRDEGKMVWLYGPDQPDPKADHNPIESLQAFTDALCAPLRASGEAFAALHVYRSGVGFSERDVRFIEAVAGYLGKGCELNRHRRKLEAENNRLRAVVPTADELIGDSSAMMTLRSQISRAAPQPFTVLISGESGSGKE
ncbi:MAG: GAF domain-containing protein, partial [Gemmataceae bacterium]